MAIKITLKADERIITGRKVKQLRNSGILPANLFGKGAKSQVLQCKASEFNSVYEKAGETNLVYLKIGNKKEVPVLISNIQVHPISSNILHSDLHQVDLTKKVTVNVPVVLVGESPAVKDGAVLVQTVKELEVEALPTNIPESINFDISTLDKIGDSLKLIQAQKIKDAEVSQDPETVVVMIQAQQQEEEVVEESTAEEVAEDETKESEDKEAKEEPKEEVSKEDSKPEEKPAEEKKN